MVPDGVSSQLFNQGSRVMIVPVLRTWMRAVSEISRSVNVADPLDTVLTRVAGLARELIGFDFCAVMLADKTTDRLDIVGSSGLSDDYVERLRNDSFLQIRPADAEADSPAARAIRDAGTVTISDVTQESETYGRLGLAPMQGYHSLVASPLHGTEAPIGVLVGYSTAPRKYGKADIELSELLAEQTATAIHTARHRARREWVEQQHRRLMQLVLAEAGLDGLVDALAEILAATVAVADPDGKILATAGTAPLTSLPDELRKHHRSTRLAPTYATQRVCVEGVDALVSPVVIGGELAARLWVIGERAVPDSARQQLVEQFTLVAGIAMLTARHTLEIEERLSGDLLTDVLRGEAFRRPQILLDRGKALGFDLESIRNIVLVRGDRIVEHLSDVSRHVQHALRTKALASSYEGNVVLLLPEVHGLLDRLDQIRHRASERTSSPATIVIGPPIRQLDGIQPAYRAANGAALLREAVSPAQVIDLRNLSSLGLMLMGDAPPVYLRELADQLMAPLARQDEQRDSQLVATVRAWLNSGFSTAQTAATLTVHVNTVGQRLTRIEKLTTRDLKLADTRLDLQLALHVWDILQT